jgi:hypothetical protein
VTSKLTGIASLRDLLENLNGGRMSTRPFAGGQRPTGKHAKGRKGQAYHRRNGKPKRKQTQPHPSTVAARAAQPTSDVEVAA